MNRESIFRELYKNHVKADKYIDSIPSDISAAIFDNEYANLLYADRSLLLKSVFDEYTDSIEWFLYDWKPGFTVSNGQIEMVVNNIDQYIDWLKRYENFS